MATTSITADQAFAAIEQLWAEGQFPNHLALRERLGHGSGPTLSRFLQEWAKTRGRELFAGQPSAPTGPAADASQQIQKAIEQATRVFLQTRSQRDAELDSREAALNTLAEHLAVQEKALLDAESRLNDREAQLERLIAELKQDKRDLAARLQAADEAAAAAEQRRDVLVSRLEEANTQNAADRADIARLSARLLELEQQVTQLRRERDQAMLERQRATEEMTARLAAAQSSLDGVRADLAHAHARIEILQRELTEATALQAGLTAERDRLDQALREAGQQYAQMERHLAQAQQQTTALAERLAAVDALRSQSEALQSALAQLAAQVARLPQGDNPPIEG